MVVIATAVNTVLLLAWIELRRPLEGILIGIEEPEFIRHVIALIYYPTLYDGTNYALHWVARRGTMPDLLCMMGSMAMLTVMLVRPVSFRTRSSGALSLTLVAIYGWANSKRWGGTDDYHDWLTWQSWYTGDKTPIHLAQRWLNEGGGLHTIWRAIGAVRALEFVVLAMVFVSLTAVALHALRPRRMGVLLSPRAQSVTHS